MNRFIAYMVTGIAAGMVSLMLGADSWTTAPLIVGGVIILAYATSKFFSLPDHWCMDAECKFCCRFQLVFEDNIRLVDAEDQCILPNDALIYDCDECGQPNEVYREDLPDDVLARVSSQTNTRR